MPLACESGCGWLSQEDLVVEAGKAWKGSTQILCANCHGPVLGVARKEVGHP